MAFWNLIASASKVIKSDLVEEANLELKLIKADIPKINLTQMEVNLEHHVLSQVTTAGEALGLSIVRDTAMTGLALLNFISQAKFKETLKPITVDPDNYAQTLQGYLLEMQNHTEKNGEVAE